MIDRREIEISFLEEQTFFSSRVWRLREFKDLNLSLTNAKNGPRVGTQATMMETFSSTLEGWLMLTEVWEGREEDEHCQYAAADTGICFAFSEGFSKENWRSRARDVQVVSLCALVRTVRAIASDPQLSTRKRSVMSLLNIRLVLAALTQFRMTLVGRAQSSCGMGGGDL